MDLVLSAAPVGLHGRGLRQGSFARIGRRDERLPWCCPVGITGAMCWDPTCMPKRTHAIILLMVCLLGVSPM